MSDFNYFHRDNVILHHLYWLEHRLTDTDAIFTYYGLPSQKALHSELVERLRAIPGSNQVWVTPPTTRSHQSFVFLSNIIREGFSKRCKETARLRYINEQQVEGFGGEELLYVDILCSIIYVLEDFPSGSASAELPELSDVEIIRVLYLDYMKVGLLLHQLTVQLEVLARKNDF
jgi:hypothetical protein